MDNFDMDAIARDAAAKSGIPLDQLKTEEDVILLRRAKDQAAAQEQAQARLQSGSETAVNLSKAGLPVQ